MARKVRRSLLRERIDAMRVNDMVGVAWRTARTPIRWCGNGEGERWERKCEHEHDDDLRENVGVH